MRAVVSARLVFIGAGVAVVLAVALLLSAPMRAPVRYQGAGFASPDFHFEYPASWRLISGLDHVGLHGPTVMVVVGTGDFQNGCELASSSVTCGEPRFLVEGDEIVLAYHFRPWLGPIVPVPTPALAPSDTWVDVDGRPAVLSSSATSARWEFAGAPELIEARWAPAATNARAQVNAVIESWRWSRDPAPSALAWLADSHCSRTVDIERDVPLDQADSLASIDQWLPGEVHGVWSGNLDALVRDIGGVVITRGQSEARIGLVDDVGPSIYRLFSSTTPKGRSVWSVVAQEHGCVPG